jgi:hypothetical protein
MHAALIEMIAMSSTGLAIVRKRFGSPDQAGDIYAKNRHPPIIGGRNISWQ